MDVELSNLSGTRTEQRVVYPSILIDIPILSITHHNVKQYADSKATDYQDERREAVSPLVYSSSCSSSIRGSLASRLGLQPVNFASENS